MTKKFYLPYIKLRIFSPAVFSLIIITALINPQLSSAQNNKGGGNKNNAHKQKVKVKGDNSSGNIQDTVKIVPDTLKAPELTENYPVLYGVQSKNRLIQSVSYLNGKQLEKFPVSFLRNAYAGQFAGLLGTQSSGQPGNDRADLSLRGRDPLILLDGVPRSLLSINPEQIASVTVLKDALATAMLGVRGMNGAILVTTKNQAVKGSEISFTAQSGVQTPLKTQTPLSAFDYATLYNEALANDGKPPVYSPADLAAYRDGTDSFGHPNINWYSTVLKKNSPYSRYTLNLNGSGPATKYFVSLDYLNQPGMLQENSVNSYVTNNNYQRYLFRSNLEIKLDKSLTAFLNIFGSIQTTNSPGTDVGTIFTTIFNTPNNAYPVFNKNGSYGGSKDYTTNPYAQSAGTGYMLDKNRTSFVDLGLRRSMDFLLKGLWVRAMLSYNSALDQQIDRSKDFEVYQQIKDTVYQRYNAKTDQVNTASIVSRGQQFYTEISAGYDHSWSRNSVNILLLANRDGYQNGSNLSSVFKGISNRISYSYDNRYQVEFAGAYNGNNYFAPGMGYGFFPAGGVSWNLQNESFFKQSIPFFNEFKLRGSYGKVGGTGGGNSLPGYYTYLNNRYQSGTSYYFGNTPASVGGVEEKPLASYQTFEKANKLNVGVDMAFARQRAWLSVDYYNNRQYDLLQQPGNSTSVLGVAYPSKNIGINRYYGYEVTAGWSDKIRAVRYYVSGNISTRNSTVIFNDEPTQASYLMTTGGRVGRTMGLIATGFYNGSFPAPAGTVTTEGYLPFLKPGDVMYKDLNNDGVINQLDITAIGTDKPLVFYGVTLGFQVKGFDLSFLIQGLTNNEIVWSGNNAWAFQNSGKNQVYEQSLNRWTPATASTATLPRLTIGTNRNNDRISTLSIYAANYLRLKNAEVGYNFNNKFLSRMKINTIRLFVNGYNLLTSSKFKMADPEDYNGGYPIQKVINGGLTVKF